VTTVQTIIKREFRWFSLKHPIISWWLLQEFKLSPIILKWISLMRPCRSQFLKQTLVTMKIIKLTWELFKMQLQTSQIMKLRIKELIWPRSSNTTIKTLLRQPSLREVLALRLIAATMRDPNSRRTSLRIKLFFFLRVMQLRSQVLERHYR